MILLYTFDSLTRHINMWDTVFIKFGHAVHQLFGSFQKLGGLDALNDIFVGAYKVMGRLEDVPLVTGFNTKEPQSCAPFNDLFALGYQSAAVGYCFGENQDHAPTADIPDAETRERMAENGEKVIDTLVAEMNMPHVVEQLRKLEEYGIENEKKYPWMPAAWNKTH